MRKSNIAISGQKIVADFQSAMLALAMADAASGEAERSESEMLNNLTANSMGNYLNPGNIDQSVSDGVARASLDAHIKKIQAKQIKLMSDTQVRSIVEAEKQEYIGRKVRIKSIDKSYSPFEALWFDPQSGYRNYDYKKGFITGKIEEILIEKNALIIKPSLVHRLFVSDLKFFVAYIINPSSLEPAVSIDII